MEDVKSILENKDLSEKEKEDKITNLYKDYKSNEEVNNIVKDRLERQTKKSEQDSELKTMFGDKFVEAKEKLNAGYKVEDVKTLLLNETQKINTTITEQKGTSEITLTPAQEEEIAEANNLKATEIIKLEEIHSSLIDNFGNNSFSAKVVAENIAKLKK